MSAAQIGYYLQLAGLIVTGGGLLYTWIQWVTGDPEHPARRNYRRLASRVRRLLGHPTKHSVGAVVGTTWNVEATATGRSFAPEEGLAGRIQALEHKVEDMQAASDRRFDAVDKSLASIRSELGEQIDGLRTDLQQTRQEHLVRTRQVAVGGLGIAAFGVLLSFVGMVVSYNAA